MIVEPDADRARLGDATIAGGDWITIAGDTGRIYLGRLDVIATRPDAELAEIAKWRAEEQSRRSA